MGTRVAVQGCIFELTAGFTGVAQVQTPPSTDTKAEGKFVYRGSIQVLYSVINWAGWTGSGGVSTGPTMFTINPSQIKKLKVNGQMALGEGDQGQAVAPGAAGTSSSPTASPQNITCKISSAGQTSVTSG